MDNLSAIFNRFPPVAKVFFAGEDCRRATFDAQDGVGHIHILGSGTLTLSREGVTTHEISEPSLLFFPLPCTHEIASKPGHGSELICASVSFGLPTGNPFVHALPQQLVMPLADLPTLSPLTEVLFAEAFHKYCGQQVALDNLITYFLVVLFRHFIDADYFTTGVFTGLSDERLAKALNAIHTHPAKQWSVESLADVCGMSRSRFAAHFREKINLTPMDYVSDWRISIVQLLLKQGKSIKQIAPKVGYQSPAALTRAFSKKLGINPSQWLSEIELTLPDKTPPTLRNYSPQARQYTTKKHRY